MEKQYNKNDSVVREIPISKLLVDPQVQRSQDPRKVDRIATNLNLDAIGVLCVSERADGTYAIIDGGHRKAALQVAGFSNFKVQCEVFKGLSLADEAAMFRWRNNTSQVQYLDKFRVRTIEGDPVALEILEILKRHGWQLGTHKRHSERGNITAIHAFERVYLLDSEVIPTSAEMTLSTVTASWGHDSSSVDGRLLEGIGLVYVRYGDLIGTDDLVARLARYPGGPGALIGNARGLARMLGTTVPRAVSEVVVEEYNKRRRTTQLPPWRAT